MTRKTFYWMIEHSGKFLILFAIICEIIYKGDPMLIVMTAGSLMVMIGDQIVYKRERKY